MKNIKMSRVLTKDIHCHLGKFCLLKMGNIVLFTSCDTRVKIINVLSGEEMTADELARSTGTAYSTIIDHMEILEKIGIVISFLKQRGGRRRIHFRLNEKASESVDKILRSNR